MRTDLLRRRRKAGRGARHLVLIDASAPRESGDLTRTTRSECRGLDGIGRVYRERRIGEVAAAATGNRVGQRRLEIHLEKVHCRLSTVGVQCASSVEFCRWSSRYSGAPALFLRSSTNTISGCDSAIIWHKFPGVSCGAGLLASSVGSWASGFFASGSSLVLPAL